METLFLSFNKALYPFLNCWFMKPYINGFSAELENMSTSTSHQNSYILWCVCSLCVNQDHIGVSNWLFTFSLGSVFQLSRLLLLQTVMNSTVWLKNAWQKMYFDFHVCKCASLQTHLVSKYSNWSPKQCLMPRCFQSQFIWLWYYLFWNM